MLRTAGGRGGPARPEAGGAGRGGQVGWRISLLTKVGKKGEVPILKPTERNWTGHCTREVLCTDFL